MLISNSVRTTHFWNNLNQIRSRILERQRNLFTPLSNWNTTTKQKHPCSTKLCY